MWQFLMIVDITKATFLCSLVNLHDWTIQNESSVIGLSLESLSVSVLRRLLSASWGSYFRLGWNLFFFIRLLLLIWFRVKVSEVSIFVSLMFSWHLLAAAWRLINMTHFRDQFVDLLGLSRLFLFCVGFLKIEVEITHWFINHFDVI